MGLEKKLEIFAEMSILASVMFLTAFFCYRVILIPKAPVATASQIYEFEVRVTLKKRYIARASELKLGVDGWEAQITSQREVNRLRRSGVPYKKGEKPMVFVADWQIIKKVSS